MKGKFYVIGTGPGDPELLTIKAVRILRESDIIAIPVSGADFSGTYYEEEKETAVREELLERCAAWKIVRQALPEKNIWAYTGFLYEDLLREGSHPRCEVTDELLGMVDVLVDGRFVEALKDISLRFRGSSNQRLIDLNATRAAGAVCLLPEQKR